MMSDKQNIRLKPCPFCGGKPWRMMWSDFYGLGTPSSGAMTAFTVICRNCLARVDAVMGSANHPYEPTEIDDWDTAMTLMQEAAERWNARAGGEKEE